MGEEKAGWLGSLLRSVSFRSHSRSGSAGSRWPSRPRIVPLAVPYRGRNSMLTAAELVFYNVLLEAIAGRFVVLLKVGIVDLCEMANRAGDEKALKRLRSARVDFLLCDRARLAPLVAIQLDHATQLPLELAERDALVSEVLRTVGVALIRQRVQPSYEAEAVSRWIDAALPRSPRPTSTPGTPLRPAS